MREEGRADTSELVARLSAKYGCAGAVQFTLSPLGGVVAELAAQGSRAVVALQGAQVLSFTPAGERDVFWLAPGARLDTGKSIRGGVPICWPWFGQHPDASKPAHGFVRAVPWAVTAAADADGAAQISLGFETTPLHAALWPHQARVRLDVTLSAVLRLDLVTENLGPESFPLTQALHSYFAISDVDNVSIDGLGGHSYADHVGDRMQRDQAGPIHLDSEVDRVFDSSPDPVTIADRAWPRRIVIGKDGSRATVVWNPWIAKSARLGDMGAGGYRRMVCVETANAARDVVTLEPGATHRLSAIIGTMDL